MKIKKILVLILILMLSGNIIQPYTYAVQDSNISLMSLPDGNYKNWKQFSGGWQTYQFPNGKTMKSVGCLVTSIAILMYGTGARTDSSFNPGTLLNELKNVGGFTGASLYWDKVSAVASNFRCVNSNIQLRGNQTQKANTIASYINKGYAVVVSVKNGGHWVAVDNVSGSSVSVCDPGSSSNTNLWHYPVSGVTRIAIFSAPNVPPVPPNNDPITISNIRYENFDSGGFNILCNVTGATKVLFPTWTTENQSDIIWEECEFDGNTANCRINASAYGWKNGAYITHIYAYDSSGNVEMTSAGSVYWPDRESPQISDVEISDISESGYTITCTVTDSENDISRVSGATWNDEIGREPEYGGTDKGKTIWIEGTVNGNKATVRVNTSEFGNRTGTYTTHIYAWDSTGNATGYGINVFVDDYKRCLDFINFENNQLKIQGWVVYKTGSDNVRITYQIDDLSEIETTRASDQVVHNIYSNYPAGNERFYGTVYGKDLPNGKHTVIVKAYVNDKYAFELGRKEFTSMSDRIPKKTVVNNNHIYSIFDVQMNWTEAEKLAINKGGYLMSITSEEEQNIAKQLIEYGSSPQYWIGATIKMDTFDEFDGNWHWVSNDEFDYTNWYPGEPNNAGGKEYYAGVYSNGTWNDFPENQKNIGYIMETEISGEPVASIENDGHYYYLYDNETDWHGAKAFCEAMGGHLVTITDKKEQALVQSLASQGSSDFTSYFIGATDNEDGSTWKWITGEKFDYTNWEEEEPNNTNDIEHYAEIYKTGMWNDRESFNNGAKNGFICEIEEDDTYTAKAEYNGNTYLRIDKSLSWEDAKAYCESRGGHLATITDEDEQEAIEDLLCRGVDTLRSAYAIGGTDADSEGTWKWITGEDFEYENWDNGKPNDGGGNSKGSQNYLTIYSKSDAFGLWDDNWNFNQNPYDIGFICEIENAKTTPEPIVKPDPIEIPDPDISTPKPEEPIQPDIDENLSTVTVGTVSAAGGETITIPISISNNQGICESKFVLNYDSTRLTPTSVVLADGFADGSLQTDIDNVSENKNTLTVTWENNSIADNTNNGNIFNVTFNVAENAAPGMIPISIDSDNLDVINANGEDISINLVGGGVAIEWPVISVENVKSQTGGTVIVPVKIENNTGINAFSFTVEYDNQAMIPIEVTEGEVIGGKGSMQSNLNDTSIDWNNQSQVTASWLSDDLENNISDNGTLFNIKFRIKDNIETGFYPVKIKYTDGDITNAAGAEIGVTTTSGGVAVEKTPFIYGDVNCDGKINIIDIVFIRKYNANLPVEISETGLLAADVNVDGKIDSKDILLMRKYVSKWNGIVLGR